MRRIDGVVMRQLLTAIALSAVAVAAMLGVIGTAGAADLPGYQPDHRPRVHACAGPGEVVVLFDENGRPTVPARTPYFYCVTGTMLIPGDIPPPPEYCCS
jgi:hypothetical protein